MPVYAIEEGDAFVAFAMGYVEGETLTERVKRAGPFGMRELVRLLQDIGYALAYAHGRGVVHRDIKPDNVMVERATGRALLMDFGISRTITTAPTGVAGLTRIGEVVGSPSYMSPEQASADTLDGRSDLYSLGLVAFFAATGRTAMSGSTPQRILVRQLTEAVPPLADERRDLPQSLTDAIDRCVAKDPAARFPNAEALVEAIDAAQLAAPEIPIPIRGFVQELGTLMLIVVVMVGFSWQVVRTAPTDLPEVLRLLPVAFFFGVALTRVLQALSVVRRLGEAGFTAADIMRGLRATVDEQDSLREQIKRSPASHVRRRRTIILALVQLPLALLLFYAAAKLNTPPAGAVAPRGGQPARATAVHRFRQHGDDHPRTTIGGEQPRAAVAIAVSCATRRARVSARLAGPRLGAPSCGSAREVWQAPPIETRSGRRRPLRTRCPPLSRGRRRWRRCRRFRRSMRASRRSNAGATNCSDMRVMVVREWIRVRGVSEPTAA